MQYNVGQFVIVAAVFTAVFSLTAVEEEARYIDWLQLLLLVEIAVWPMRIQSELISPLCAVCRQVKYGDVCLTSKPLGLRTIQINDEQWIH